MLFQRPPALPGVIFDSDMCVNIDCALALAVLYGAAAKVKVVGLTVTNPDLEGAVYCDVVARFYTTGGKLNNTPLHYYFPIGYEGDGERRSDSTLAKGLVLKAPDGSPAFGVNVKDVTDTGAVAVVVRNALTGRKAGDALMFWRAPSPTLSAALRFRAISN
jgi:hypothetical protein